MRRPKLTRVISFRVTEEDWLKIERAAADCADKPHEWCRTLALETLKLPVALTPSQRILFGQIARTTFLIENGLTLLAEDSLEPDLWKNYRTYARANLDLITDRALADSQSKTES